MTEKFDSMEKLFGGGDGEQYIAPQSTGAEVVSLTTSEVEMVAPKSEPPAGEIDPNGPGPGIAPETHKHEPRLEAAVSKAEASKLELTPEQQADYARLKEIGVLALNDLPHASGAVQSLNRMIDEEKANAKMGDREQPSLLDGLYVAVGDGVEVEQYDIKSLERQIAHLDTSIKEIQEEINRIGFFSDFFGKKRRGLEGDIARVRRNKNIASSRLGKVNEFTENIQQFVRQIPSAFLPKTSTTMTLEAFLDKVQPILDEALALKRKYPKYKTIIGE